MSSPISGFTAIPNPQMLAFMPIQSYLMMYFAGSGWQYGKRKISAMSNEQFNKLTPEELLQQHSIELKNMLPTLEKSLNDVTPLVKILIEQYGDFIVEALKVTPKVVQQVTTGVKEFVTEEVTGEDSFLAYLKSLNLFPNLPSAEARRGSLQTIGATQQFTTSSSSTVARAREQARQKQLSYELQLREKQKFSREFEKTKQLIAQLSVIEQARTSKRKAGQSQIMERKKLIGLISTFTSQINSFKRRSANSTSGILKTAMKVKIQQRVIFIRKQQQLLVNLLTRYRF